MSVRKWWENGVCRVELSPRDHRHGTIGGYSNWDCRCDRCTKAHSAYHKAYVLKTGRVKRTIEEIRANPRWKHGGKYSYYDKKCRCEKCMDWMRNDKRRQRAKRYARGLDAEGKPRKPGTRGGRPRRLAV